MNVAIVGAGEWNESAVKYWRTQGSVVTVYENARAMIRAAQPFDLVVRSTKIHPAELKKAKVVTTEVREFFKRCPARIIGVTGSTGQTVTGRYVARILEEAGKRVWRGGGDGKFLLEFLGKVKAGDLVVLELSSCQLMDLDVSPHFAVCLGVSPERRDFEWDMREYVAAMGNLFWHQRSEDVAVYDASNDFATQIALLSPGGRVPFLKPPGALARAGSIEIGDTVLGKTSDFELTSQETIEYVCAAVTVATQVLGVGPDAVRRALAGLAESAKE